jgi:hypothetical protein
MKLKTIVALAICAGFAFSGSAHAQDLGPQFSKLKYVGKNLNSNCGAQRRHRWTRDRTPLK